MISTVAIDNEERKLFATLAEHLAMLGDLVEIASEIKSARSRSGRRRQHKVGRVAIPAAHRRHACLKEQMQS